jgi:hypothetical protein
VCGTWRAARAGAASPAWRVAVIAAWLRRPVALAARGPHSSALPAGARGTAGLGQRYRRAQARSLAATGQRSLG